MEQEALDGYCVIGPNWNANLAQIWNSSEILLSNVWLIDSGWCNNEPEGGGEGGGPFLLDWKPVCVVCDLASIDSNGERRLVWYWVIPCTFHTFFLTHISRMEWRWTQPPLAVFLPSHHILLVFDDIRVQVYIQYRYGSLLTIRYVLLTVQSFTKLSCRCPTMKSTFSQNTQIVLDSMAISSQLTRLDQKDDVI